MTSRLDQLTHLSLEIPALPVALLLALEPVGVALAAGVGEGRALAGAGVEVPLAQLVVARTFREYLQAKNNAT